MLAATKQCSRAAARPVVRCAAQETRPAWGPTSGPSLQNGPRSWSLGVGELCGQRAKCDHTTMDLTEIDGFDQMNYRVLRFISYADVAVSASTGISQS